MRCTRVPIIRISLIVPLLLLAACKPSTDSFSSAGGASSLAAPSPIQISQPDPGDLVTSPLTVTGQAQGSWYFEASFPVRLLDGQGKEIASTPAQAQGDWMTTGFVPFKATLTFVTKSRTGSLLFEKDNPSGEPQNAGTITVPVRFQ